MKKVLLILGVLVTGGFVSAQVNLSYDGESLTTNLLIDSASSSVELQVKKLYLVNNNSATTNVRYSRERLYHTAGWTDQVCDNDLCFTASDASLWNRPGGIDVQAGDSTVFKPQVQANNVDGCAIYKYRILVGGVAVDSVIITYTINGMNCSLGSEEVENELMYSVYPNPANEVLNIEVANTQNSTIVIYDIAGKKVTNMLLVNGVNQLNIESLNTGIYFYSVLSNGEILETKKLLIK